jgi:hypothetical protein
VADEKVFLKKNDDDSTDIWFAGWRVRFAKAPNVRPDAIKEDPPDPTKQAGDKVQLGTVNDKTYLQFGAWTMVFEADRTQQPHAQRDDPEPAPKDHTLRVRLESI